ncbi:MAG: S1/P1 nuclease [Nitrospinae bacterium]|nr:S1/P1 nuclease [Nitrospinota bacterium]
MFRGKKTIRLVYRFCLVITLLAINFGVAHGWGPQGHRVIGYVAEFNLVPQTKKIIAEEFNIKNLADVANWADKVRKKSKHEKPWHYTNIKENEWTYVVLRDCPDKNCVTEKIKEFSRALERKETPLAKRKDALKYLVHFVGDIHEPLHLGNRKDRGGGKIRLDYLGRNVTLHYLWDGGLIDWEKESLLKYATHLNDKLVGSEKSKWLDAHVDDWANESRSLALKYAYPLGSDGLSKVYIMRGRKILDQRMVQAGLRLAELLNRILKTKK